ncbi:MAG TPA: DsbE family thiol:disulfide interchange protein [Patescibacteria group bacterium]|nr:DsbE family thiol:disulfide interchange protein [Patescibacteria group bacterium]
MKAGAYMPLILLAIIVALFAVPLVQGRDPAIIPSAMIGKPLPDFVLPPALPGGAPLESAKLRQADRPYLVNFFASWCLTCRAEQAVLAAYARESGVLVYGIDYKDTRKDVSRWLDAYGNPFAAVGFDDTGRVAIDWGVYGVPETFVVDSRGIIRYKHVGPLREEDITRLVRPVLEKLK